MSTSHGSRSNSTTSSVVRSNLTACDRCRRKKKRCDGRMPQCRLCEIAGADCVSYDAVNRTSVPRSYVHSLEERVAFLESKLQERGAQVNTANEAQGQFCEAASPRRVDLVARLSVDQPSEAQAMVAAVTSDRISPSFAAQQSSLSELFLSDLAHNPSASGKDLEGGPFDDCLSSDVLGELDTSRLVLPTKHAAESLVKAYFRFANLSQPLLYEPYFRRTLDYLYSMPPTIDFNQTHGDTQAKLASFFVLEVFAVALLVLQKQDPARIPTSLADRYHKTALLALTSVGLPATIEGVQALLLVSQYFYHHPTDWTVWKTVGAALRLAVELGLHHESRAGQLDFLTTDIRRRTFWVAYALDRNIAYALCRPSCLADGAIDTGFPSDVDDQYITAHGLLKPPNVPAGPKCVNLHVLRFRLIQSEMQTVLFQKTPPGYVPIDLSQWREQMHEKIQAWYDSVPRDSFSPDYQRKVVENFELTYFRALFYLYHPSKNLPSQDDNSLAAVADAAAHMIKLYKRFFDERRLTIYWQAVENLSSAGIALLRSYRASLQVQNQIGLGHLQMLTQTCSSVLGGMVEHFPMFRNKRDSFDEAASRVLGAPTTDIGDSSRTEERQNEHFNGDSTRDQTYSDSQNVSDEHQSSQLHALARQYTQPGTANTLPDPQVPCPSAGGPGLGTVQPTAREQEPIALSYEDFENAAFDWDAVEAANEFLVPSWF